MTLHTTDLSDAYENRCRSLALAWNDYGGRSGAAGRAATLLVFEDNAQVRAMLETEGEGRILVVAGGGSLRSALLGGNLAKLAAGNGWAGVVIDGAVRDAHECLAEAVCIKALGTAPRKSAKAGEGAEHVPVLIGGAIVRPGDILVMDGDGVVCLRPDPDIVAAVLP
ncbi:hypothetical protein CSC94_07850 [Zhengella mangrovi]|uniref:4-hydroxy-4-methyl-2-oxoglutarate aldolase n=1 Tax=Zhengella mangrovi TaxID=1982044 RepID=A0A2G1QQ63_9HYPH|nr:ribonuclease E activity regulator RraA [Zhengella mangrovi]PHP67604.1 hypothetical protein CSC94_07850 [Zhengella mangrovi]